jgi:hypothetical protein
VGRTSGEGVRQWGAEEDICASEGGSKRRLEKAASKGAFSANTIQVIKLRRLSGVCGMCGGGERIW